MKHNRRSVIAVIALLTLWGGSAQAFLFCGGAPVTGLVFNSAGAASANSAIIETALAAGGIVQIACPPATPIFYINSPMVVRSHTTLQFSNCQPTLATNTNGPAIVNYAYTRPWSYLNGSNITWTNSGSKLEANLYWPSHGLSVGSWVHVNAAPDTPAWAASTHYDLGIIAINSGKKYHVTTAGTSASSGGPTGTGGSISDGSVVWAYDASFGGTASYYWTGAGSAGAQGGIVDTAYLGVFYVSAVTDSDNVTIILRRVPAVAFSNIPIIVRATDHDVEVDGGGSTIDCNGANQSGTVTNQVVCMMPTGMARSTFRDLNLTNFKKWAVGVQGGQSLLFDHVDGSPEITYSHANQNQYLFYGCTDCTVQHNTGWGQDDNIAINNSAEPVSHSDELWTSGGDNIGFHEDFIQTVHGYAALSIWPIHPAFIMDDITIDHVRTHSTNGQSMPVVRFISSNEAYPIAQAAFIGTIKISNTELRDSNVPVFSGAGTNGDVYLQQLILDNVSVGPNLANSIAVLIKPVAGTAWVVDNITLQNSNLYASDLIQPYTSGGLGTLTVKTINITNNVVTAKSSGSGSLVAPNSTTNLTLGTINIEGNTITNLGSLVNAIAPAKININNNNIVGAASNTSLVKIGIAGSTTSFCGNTVNTMGYAFIRYTAAVTSTAYSCGNNVITGTAPWFRYDSAGTTTVYGWDIQGDITKMIRTTGSYFYNTNAAPGSGTLNIAGPVMDQGTGSNSWFSMSNPTGLQY